MASMIFNHSTVYSGTFTIYSNSYNSSKVGKKCNIQICLNYKTPVQAQLVFFF